MFEDGDYRKEMLFWATDPGADVASAAYVSMRNSKFRFRDIENQLGDIVLMRVAEIYLINAEAKAHLNDPDAINKLNDLKTARGAKTIHTNLSQQDLLETIWLERRKELWGEGFSLIDIIRNQQTVVRKAYPEGPIDYIYTDENGQTHTLKKIVSSISPIKVHSVQTVNIICTELRIRKSWRTKTFTRIILNSQFIPNNSKL